MHFGDFICFLAGFGAFYIFLAFPGHNYHNRVPKDAWNFLKFQNIFQRLPKSILRGWAPLRVRQNEFFGISYDFLGRFEALLCVFRPLLVKNTTAECPRVPDNWNFFKYFQNISQRFSKPILRPWAPLWVRQNGFFWILHDFLARSEAFLGIFWPSLVTNTTAECPRVPEN